MASFQDTIDKQLKIIEDGNEIINNEEFFLICEADYYRPPGEKWYSKHRQLTSTGRKIGASVVSVVTLGAYGWFRKVTDRCRQNCKEIEGKRKQRCVAICNMNASKRVVQKIKANKSELAKITDPEKRKKAKRIIDTEQNKWESRYDKYKNQVVALAAMVTQIQTTMKTKKT